MVRTADNTAILSAVILSFTPISTDDARDISEISQKIHARYSKKPLYGMLFRPRRRAAFADGRMISRCGEALLMPSTLFGHLRAAKAILSE